MTGLSQGFSLSVLFHNVHLFGQTALYTHRGATRETGFYYRDDERLPQLIDRYKKSDADIIGLAEVWDADMRTEMQGALRSEYPYQMISPAAPGIGRVIDNFQERWPRLAGLLFGPCGGVVNYFTKSHYTPDKPGLFSAIGSYLSEDLFVRGLARWLRSGPVWGAGLLFLSRYPIVSADFYPHDRRADWEMLAGKGVIEATVRPEQGIEVTFSLGHYQEGLSRRAASARGSQIQRARRRTLPVSNPLVHFGDFNVPADSYEYEAMNRILRGLRDVQAGNTYLEPNPYQDKLQAPRGQAPQSQRIDYLFHNDDLLMGSARVMREEFRSDDGEYDLSDHFALRADFSHRPLAVVQAFPRVRERRPALVGQAAAGF